MAFVMALTPAQVLRLAEWLAVGDLAPAVYLVDRDLTGDVTVRQGDRAARIATDGSCEHL